MKKFSIATAILFAGFIVGGLASEIRRELAEVSRKQTYKTYQPDDSLLETIPKIPDRLIAFEYSPLLPSRVRSLRLPLESSLELLLHDESPFGMPRPKSYLLDSSESPASVINQMDASAASAGWEKDNPLCQDLPFGFRRVYRRGDHTFMFVLTASPELLDPVDDQTTPRPGYYAAAVACTLERTEPFGDDPMAWEPEGIRFLSREGKLTK